MSLIMLGFQDSISTFTIVSYLFMNIFWIKVTIFYHFDILSTNFFVLGDYNKMNHFRINPNDKKKCFVSDQGPLIAFIVMFSFHHLRGPLKSTHHLLGLISHFLLPTPNAATLHSSDCFFLSKLQPLDHLWGATLPNATALYSTGTLHRYLSSLPCIILARGTTVLFPIYLFEGIWPIRTLINVKIKRRHPQHS